MRDKTTIKDYYDAWDKLDVVFLNIYSRIIFLGRWWNYIWKNNFSRCN